MWVKINPQRRHLKIRKSAESQRVLDALNAYVDDNSNEPMKWLVSMWQDQQNAFGYEQLRQIVLDEISPQAIFDKWFQDYSGFIREKMTPLWRQGIAAGAYSHPRIQALQAEGFKVVTSSANVRSWLLDRTGELVTNCTNNQIESLRYIIAEARSKGLSSDETARYIRPTIGLTRQQAGANMKLYESTKAQLRKDHPRMTDESIERKARDIAAKDAAKKQRTRAVTIARTENAYAYNYGNDEAIKQAEAAGLMPHMVPYWSTSHSGNVCPVCEALEGIAIDEGTGQFSTTWHNRDYTCELPPMHPRCMCAVEYREETEERVTAPAGTSEENTVDNPQENDRMESEEIHPVYTNGKRNEEDLTDEQFEIAKAAAIKQGYDGDIVYTPYTWTAFHHITEGDPFHFISIGTDAFPAANPGPTANEQISVNGCMAHEVIGHYEAWKRGTTQSIDALEEAQASIRASKFGVDLTDQERGILYQDALDRLSAANIKLEDVEKDLDIWER